MSSFLTVEIHILRNMKKIRHKYLKKQYKNSVTSVSSVAKNSIKRGQDARDTNEN